MEIGGFGGAGVLHTSGKQSARPLLSAHMNVPASPLDAHLQDVDKFFSETVTILALWSPFLYLLLRWTNAV